MKTLTITLDEIDKAIAELESIRDGLQEKIDRLCERLMSLGAMTVSAKYASLEPFISDNGRDYRIEVRKEGTEWVLTASGTEVLFLEFGAGNRYGWGHPEPMEYGPGTYNPDYPTPLNPNWSNPKGWWTPMGQHSYGNPPAMGMYSARKEMIEAMLDFAREIFDG